MEASSSLHMDVEPLKSQVLLSVQTSEGFSTSTQTGFLNSTSSHTSVNDYTQHCSSTPLNGSASSNVVPSPSSPSANTQMMNTNPLANTASLGVHGGLSSSTSALDSYKSTHTEGGMIDGKQHQFHTSAAFSNPQVARNGMPSSGSVYTPVPNQYVYPHTYVPGTALPTMFPPSSATQHAAQNAFRGGPLLVPDSRLSNPNFSPAVTREISNMSSSAFTVQPMQLPIHNSLASNAIAAPTPNVRPGTAWTSLISGNPGNSLGPNYPAAPMGHWLPTSHSTVLPRPHFFPHPSNAAASLPGMPHPSAQFSTSQPRVNPAVLSNATPMPPSASGFEVQNDSGMMLDLPPGTGGDKFASDIKKSTADKDQANGWTSHKTEAGVIYYYNALTGESTYDRPPGFKEVTMAKAQPTPASWEKVAGTDWVSVTTNDGNNYYYNSKTKLSSWQIPIEVVEVRRKRDAELSNERSTVVLSDTQTDKESGVTRLDTPAINPENHDVSSSNLMVLPSTSALDSIKKKLQESATLENVSLVPAATVLDTSELNGSMRGERSLENESYKGKPKDANANNNLADSSSESDDHDSGPTKEQCISQFKEMLKERGVAPFSKWEKELPKIVFDSRFKAIPSHSMRRSLFDHYVKTRAEEERKEKRAAQKAAIDGFKQLLQEASEDTDHNTNYNTFESKWGDDKRFKALNRKDIEVLLNERIIPLRKAADEKAQAIRAEATTLFKSMLKEKTDIDTSTRWSKVKDSLRSDPRYKSVEHEDREVLFNEYISDLKAAEEEKAREAKNKRQEREKLRERERELRKRKEREEEEIERMRLKVRRKEAVSSYQALLVEVIKDPQASWTESRPKLEKDPQGRASNPELESSELEKLFREHVNMLLERCASDFKVLLTEALTGEVASHESEDGKTVYNSWSTAKEFLRNDPRYAKMPRKEREILWRRYAESMQRKRKETKEEDENGKGIQSQSRSRRRHENR
ncbi:unnamed protein product [Rhodiola kirilowii]